MLESAEVTDSAHEGKIALETTLAGLSKGVAEVRMRVARKGTEVLNTKVRLSSGRTILIGGPRVREGIIIYTLHAGF